MLQKSSELTRKPWFGWPMTWFFFIFGYCTHVGRLCLIIWYLKLVFPTHHRVATSRPPSPPLLLSPCVRPSSSFLALQIYLYQSSLYQPHLYPTYCISVLISIALCLPPSLSLYQTYPHQTFYHTYLHQTYLSQTFSLSKLPLSNKSLTHLSSKLISIKITFVRFITPIKNKPLPSWSLSNVSLSNLPLRKLCQLNRSLWNLLLSQLFTPCNRWCDL